MSRAIFLRSAATESSRSRISPSAPNEGPLASLRSESAGTNRKERIGSVPGFLAHQRLAGALGDGLAALVDGGVGEFDDAGVGPRLALAHAQDLGLYAKRIAVEDRLGKAHVGHAEIGDRGAERGVVHGDADHQAEREQAVDDALAELGLAGEFLVEMQRLHVHGERAEQHIVHFGHGARPGMLERLACSNFLDTLIIQDKYQFKPARPFAPGHEVAGDIVEVGEGISGYKVGDRVIGSIGSGGYATEAVVDEGQLLPMPKNMSYEDGAAFTMTYGTSYYALKQRSSMKPGEILLVTGASGGVGLTAVELGALMGLKVIAAVGSDEKAEITRKYGATMFVNYTKEKMRDKVKELTGGKGADIIYDAVGGDAFDESIRSIAWYGRLLVVGFASGRIPSLPANLALLKSCDVRGVFYGAWRTREPREARKNFDEMFAWFAEGKLKPHISMRFPLEKAADAMNALLSRKATGKVVLTMT